jgi:CheY-specific phosphatase CheX
VQIVELDPGDRTTAQSVAKWTPIVAERQEKMKEEVLGKLKELGNSVLGNFGMSLDNFKMDKDPNTGGYSIRFGQ